MANTFHLQIVTPTGPKLDGQVESVTVTTTEGDVGILKNHINYMAAIPVGKIKVRQEGKTRKGAVAGGFVRVERDKTVIVVETCEWCDEIDTERARRSKERAEEALRLRRSDDEVKMAQYRLKKALNRMKIVENQD